MPVVKPPVPWTVIVDSTKPSKEDDTDLPVTIAVPVSFTSPLVVPSGAKLSVTDEPTDKAVCPLVSVSSYKTSTDPLKSFIEAN